MFNIYIYGIVSPVAVFSFIFAVNFVAMWIPIVWEHHETIVFGCFLGISLLVAAPVSFGMCALTSWIGILGLVQMVANQVYVLRFKYHEHKFWVPLVCT